jgi:RimJ/RimL family protein N-acetyltransferase
MDFYEGDHVLIRPLTAADVFALYPRPDVGAVLAAYRPWLTTAQGDLNLVVERLKLLAALTPATEIEALVLHRPSGSPLGFLCLAAIDPLNGKAELAAAFFRGRGSRPAIEAIHWALEKCFGSLGLHKLVFYTVPDNHAALGILKALGAYQEGLLKEELAVQNGKRLDLMRHALLRADWLDGGARRRLARIAPLAAKPL